MDRSACSEKEMNVEVRSLGFSYPGREVLKEINLSFREPGIIGLIGENGSGKSTLIRCLCGLQTIEKETIFYGGRDLKKIPVDQRARFFSYVPQKPQYSHDMSVYDYLLLGRKPYFQWRPSESDLQIVDSTVDEFRLADLAFRKLGNLSGGELQKVCIARSFVQDTPIIYLDEPTNNLDIRYQLNLMHLLQKRSRERGTVIVMAVHDLNIAYRFADSLCLMHEGRIFASGHTEDVLTEENLKTAMGIRCTIEQGSRYAYICSVEEHNGE